MKIINEENYVDFAEGVIGKLIFTDNYGNKKVNLSTSKIRSILAMSAELYNEVLLLESEKLDKNILSRLDYLRIRMLYDAGREPKKVKKFIEVAKLLEIIKSITTKKEYILFYHYMEALVAFHKYNGGED